MCYVCRSNYLTFNLFNYSITDNDRKINESIRLSDFFYKPYAIEADGMFDGLVRGLATQTVQKMDLHLVSDVRCINIQNPKFAISDRHAID